MDFKDEKARFRAMLGRTSRDHYYERSPKKGNARGENCRGRMKEHGLGWGEKWGTRRVQNLPVRVENAKKSKTWVEKGVTGR